MAIPVVDIDIKNK